jgi:hypothetical protein
MAGFERAGIHPINEELIISPLPQKCPSFLLLNVKGKKKRLRSIMKLFQILLS